MVDQIELLDSRILIVDDDPTVVRFLERILGKEGYRHIRSLMDSQQVTTVYTEFRPDLVILDLHMPGVGGFQVMEQLKVLEPEFAFLPILVLTGDTTRDTRLRALGAGARDYLEKPLDLEVISRIRNALEVRLLYRQLQRQNRQLENAVERREAELAAARRRAAPLLTGFQRLRLALAETRRAARETSNNLSRATRLQDAVSAILDYASLRSGTLDLVDFPFELGICLRDLVGSGNGSIRLEYQGNAWARGDPGRLRQLLSVLLWHPRQTGDPLTLSVEPVLQADGLLFEFRMSRPPRLDYLQEQLATELLSVLGGQGKLESGRFELPLEPFQGALPSPQSLEACRIAVVEHEDTRARFEEALAGWGAIPVPWDGPEPPDLVLWDLERSADSGFDEAARRRRELPTSRWVFTTTAGQPGDAAAALRAGGCGYLSRPAPAEDTRRMLELCLGLDPAPGGGVLVTRHTVRELSQAGLRQIL